MEPYDHKALEAKWQKKWAKDKLYEAREDSKKKKFYALIEFPYPSGDGLHVGHIRSNTAMDIISRKRRAEGFEVLYPIGWDAFGLPTENYAIKTGVHPKIVTEQNSDNFRRQLQALGFAFDWSREINTTDPDYYKWTQWIFLKFLEKGLAYKKKMAVNWCPKDKTGLANEEVVDGKCERCGTLVEKRDKEQWMLAITKYADRLDKDLDLVDFLPQIKTQQRNWIGKSEGSEIDFEFVFKNGGKSGKIPVYTTRADTLYGVTYVVLSPEHLWVTLALDDEHKGVLDNADDVRLYVAKFKNLPELERTREGREKTGIELKGVKAINPATQEEIPVFIADYVLADYGTGAVMAVPAHDERDWDFAKKYNLPIKQVIAEESSHKLSEEQHLYTGQIGFLVNSQKFDGLTSEDAKKKITESVGGRIVTKYKLRDWVFSRQRYWGEPIPVIHCAKCGFVPVPEKDLPVELPDVKDFKPREDGESPLASAEKWVNVKCPSCGGKARRETDTMPNWAGSSWYYLAYIMQGISNFQFPISKYQEAFKYWTPVDWYNGGMEHTTLHLLYSRFWHKFLFDLELVPTVEPYQKRTSHGLILAEGGVKMSKSKGNVINPDGLVSAVGADSLRVYEMFMGPFDQAISWDTQSIAGSRRFIERVWNLQNKLSPTAESTPNASLLHQTIKKVSEDIEAMKFNTAISSLMILLNAMEKEESIAQNDYATFVKLLSPFAPHVTEEIWHVLGNKESVHLAEWPVFDPAKLISSMTTIVVQINGKVRAQFEIETGSGEEAVKKQALSLDIVTKAISDKEIKRLVYVPNKIINVVV